MSIAGTRLHAKSTAVSAQLSDPMVGVLLAWLRGALHELQTPDLAVGSVIDSARALLDAARGAPQPLQIELEVAPVPPECRLFFRARPVEATAEVVRTISWADVALSWRQVRVHFEGAMVEIQFEEIPCRVTRPRW